MNFWRKKNRQQTEFIREIESKPGLEARFNHGVKVFEKQKLYYIETPKVACTSIKSYFLNALGFSYDKADQSIHQFANEKLSSPSEMGYNKFFRWAARSDVEALIVFRDPLERLRSAYKDKIARTTSEPSAAGFARQRRHIADWCDTRRSDDSRQYNPTGDVHPSFYDFLWFCAESDLSTLNHHWAPQTQVTWLDQLPNCRVWAYENLDEVFSYLDEKFSDSSSLNRPALNYSGQSKSKHAFPQSAPYWDALMNRYSRDKEYHERAL